ncbi:MAG: hypothetical protein PHN88_11815 [Ignavibacteria bacterium]|nr:hypothetical protein [Ignavibacteria bacterium]
MKNFIITVLILFISTTIFAQSGKTTSDKNYNFSITVTKNWTMRNTVETNKKDVITYSFDKNDGKVTLSLIAFKFANARNLDDFIYTLEKDFNLNIPEKTGGYTELNGDKYTGKSGEYKDNDSYEKIYYYSTATDISGEYFCYMVRFIVDAKANLNDAKSDINTIADSFKIKF